MIRGSEASAPTPPRKEPQPRRARASASKKVDLTVKILATLAALAVPVVAYLLQQGFSNTSLLSQRELAESQLRATLLSNLIQPIAGQAGTSALAPDRERLLAELLALNFHEHIEMKPLMLDTDERLPADRSDPAGSKDPGRSSLRSTARRVASRQIASLVSEGEGQNDATRVYKLFVIVDSLAPDSTVRCAGDSVPYYGTLGHTTFQLSPPDLSYVVSLTPHSPDWDKQTVKCSVMAALKGRGLAPEVVGDFTLTWYDFPLTDNTLLRNGNRYSAVLNYVSEDRSLMVLTFVWFPKGYFTARERPVDYRELAKLSGRKPD